MYLNHIVREMQKSIRNGIVNTAWVMVYKKAFERIVSGCPAAEWEDDEDNLDEI